jgi:hypothetical protein
MEIALSSACPLVRPVAHGTAVACHARAGNMGATLLAHSGTHQARGGGHTASDVCAGGVWPVSVGIHPAVEWIIMADRGSIAGIGPYRRQAALAAGDAAERWQYHQWACR